MWDADLADIKEFVFYYVLLSIDIHSKYTSVVPLKHQKGITTFNRKPSKKWVDKGSEVHNRSMK